MDKTLALNIEEFNIIDDYSDSQLAIVEIYVCHDGNNLHNLPIDLSALKSAKKTLKNKFLVAGYDGNDFEGHEEDEQIVGFFPESSKMRFEKKDGKTFLVAQAIMSKIYADWAYDIFVEENDRAVSMEITVLDSEIDENDGLEHITKFVFNGVTLLGKKHQPACEGASASIIKFSKENALKVYSKHFENSNEIKKNFVESMELADNSRKEDATMKDEKELETVMENPEVKEEDKTQNVNLEDIESDETTYMEDKEEDDKDADIDDKEEEEREERDDNESEDDDVEEEDMSAESKEFESLTVEQKYEVFRSAVRETLGCGYLESFDDEYVYVYIFDEGYTYRYSYTLDGTTATIDKDSKTRVMRGGYVEFETYVETSKELDTLKNENCELKEKLFAYEEAEKSKAVEGILASVVDVLSAERIAELREESKDYSLDNLSVFSNEVKAIAFEVLKDTNGKYSFNKMPINEVKKTNKYSWSK